MMKHTLRCHDFGWKAAVTRLLDFQQRGSLSARQNRASPQRVAARIAASFVARLANIDILAAPRFALSTILARNARALHHLRGSGSL
jgi:hypothetical protein